MKPLEGTIQQTLALTNQLLFLELLIKLIRSFNRIYCVISLIGGNLLQNIADKGRILGLLFGCKRVYR